MKIKYLFAFVIIGLLFSCKKDAVNSSKEYIQNDTFFSRGNNLPNNKNNSRIIANSVESIPKNDVIDTILNMLKEEDLKIQFVDKIVNKYGLANWDCSLILKNVNGLKTVITPISDSSNKVNLIIISYQLSNDKAYFRIVNRFDKQEKLPTGGDLNGKIFTKKTLEGIFNSLEARVKKLKTSSIISNGINKSNSFESYMAVECWYYVLVNYSNGDFLVSNTQCSFNLTISTQILQNIQYDESLISGNSTSSTSFNIPDFIDPIYNCNCGCIVDDEMINVSEAFEPKWGQLGDLSTILLEVNRSISNTPNYSNMSLSEKLNNLKQYFDADRRFVRDPATNKLIDRSDSKKIDRYIYTTQMGWIDMHHLFFTAYLSEVEDRLFAIVASTNLELFQLFEGLVKQKYSGYSYEDLPSNIAGIQFYSKYREGLKNRTIKIEDALTEFLSEKGAVSYYDAPNIDFIPHVIDNSYPKNYSFLGLTGIQLFDITREAFCKKSKEMKKNIQDAHIQLSPSSNK